MMNPIDIHSRLASEAHNPHKPEGVSVMVVQPLGIELTDEQLLWVALEIAKVQYAGMRLTGEVLFVGRDELGERRHEVVLEVA